MKKNFSSLMALFGFILSTLCRIPFANALPPPPQVSPSQADFTKIKPARVKVRIRGEVETYNYGIDRIELVIYRNGSYYKTLYSHPDPDTSMPLDGDFDFILPFKDLATSYLLRPSACDYSEGIDIHCDDSDPDWHYDWFYTLPGQPEQDVYPSGYYNSNDGIPVTLQSGVQKVGGILVLPIELRGVGVENDDGGE